MSDDVDRANDEAERLRMESLRLRKREIAVQPTGKCLNCSMPVDGRRWCNSACRDDWQKEQGSD